MPRFVTPDQPPSGKPNIDPDEAIAIALSICIGREVRPEGKMVEMVRRALREAGWAIVPKSEGA